MRRFSGIALCILCLWQVGCAAIDETKETAGETIKAFTPKSGGYKNSNDDFVEDEWAMAGREARGDQSKDHEHDKLTPYLMSPKARSIENSLGID